MTHDDELKLTYTIGLCSPSIPADSRTGSAAQGELVKQHLASNQHMNCIRY